MSNVERKSYTKLEKQMLQICENFGANNARIIDVNQIVFNKQMREWCKDNVCGNYGKNYGCPPAAGTPDELINKAKQYSKALIIQTISEINNFEGNEDYNDALEFHNMIMFEVRDELKKLNVEHHAIGGGHCRICSMCSCLYDKPCKFPEKMMVSLSAYCIEVGKLATTCGLKYVKDSKTVTYFGLILFDRI